MLFSIGITIGLYVLVAVMAQKRNRSIVVWVLLSLLGTPLLMIIILLIIGKKENYIDHHYDRDLNDRNNNGKTFVWGTSVISQSLRPE